MSHHYHYFAAVSTPSGQLEIDGLIITNNPLLDPEHVDSFRDQVRKTNKLPATANVAIRSLSYLGESSDGKGEVSVPRALVKKSITALQSVAHDLAGHSQEPDLIDKEHTVEWQTAAALQALLKE